MIIALPMWVTVDYKPEKLILPSPVLKPQGEPTRLREFPPNKSEDTAWFTLRDNRPVFNLIARPFQLGGNQPYRKPAALSDSGRLLSLCTHQQQVTSSKTRRESREDGSKLEV